MSRYKHFDDELSGAEIAEAAVLPELDVDEADHLEFKPQLRTYPSTTTVITKKFNFNSLKILFFQRTFLERFLLISILILLSLLFFLSLTVVYHQHRLIPVEELCLTSACIQVSAAIHAGLNETADPCEDFYEFTCGRWAKTNVIPKGHSSWSTMKELSQKNIIILKGILEENIPNPSSSSSDFNAEYEAVKFYRSCLNLVEIENRQIEPLERFFKENFNFTIQQWIHIDQNRTWQEQFVAINNHLSKAFGFTYLLPFSIGPDDKNSSWNVLHVGEQFFFFFV